MTASYEVRGAAAVILTDAPPVQGLGHATRRAIAEPKLLSLWLR